MKAHLDENLSLAFARALHCLVEDDDHSVVHSTSLAPMGTPDVDLFKEVAAAGIQVHITQDHHYRRVLERKAIIDLRLTVFVLAKGWSSQPYFDKAARLIQWWPRLIEQAESAKPPVIFRVPWLIEAKGRLERVRLDV